MTPYLDIVEMFASLLRALEQNSLSLQSPLEEMVLRTVPGDLAYVDNRRNAKDLSGVDFWAEVTSPGNHLDSSFLYSKSDKFPDFLFKTRLWNGGLKCGSLLELKDARSGGIASFNSTLPTKTKSLEEIDILNSGDLVSRIAMILDGESVRHPNYLQYQRRAFYLIRTHNLDSRKVKVSIVDGSFFETVPKESLIYQMFLNVFRRHLEKKEIELPPDLMKLVEESLSHVTDQTIIASSQNIPKASIRPRLRLMAEVHAEGNPHSTHYPEILPYTLNLIVQETNDQEAIRETLAAVAPEIRAFTIQHKRNGLHTVFQYSIRQHELTDRLPKEM